MPKEGHLHGQGRKVTFFTPAQAGKQPVSHAFFFIACHVLEIELIEVRELAIPAPDREDARTDENIMGTGYVAVPACRILHKFPDRILQSLAQFSRRINIFDPGNEDPCRTAMIADHLCLIRYCGNNLVRDFPAMITVCPIFR
jgi:hypothetical protein